MSICQVIGIVLSQKKKMKIIMCFSFMHACMYFQILVSSLQRSFILLPKKCALAFNIGSIFTDFSQPEMKQDSYLFRLDYTEMIYAYHLSVFLMATKAH